MEQRRLAPLAGPPVGIVPATMRSGPDGPRVPRSRPGAGCHGCPVRQHGVCAALGRGGEQERLAEVVEPLHLQTDAVLWSGEAGARPVYGVLVTGILRSLRYGYDGRRHVMSLVLPGELVGEGLVREGLSLEAATPVRLCRLPVAAFRRLRRESPRFREIAYDQAAEELERLRYFTLSLGALHPEERLAAFLAMAARAMPWQPLPGGGGVLTLVLARADVADLLGTSVETLSRVLQRFHREGLLKIRDPRHFEIPDLARLAGRGALAGTLPFAEVGRVFS